LGNSPARNARYLAAKSGRKRGSPKIAVLDRMLPRFPFLVLDHAI
jgi:hypothetical protein